MTITNLTTFVYNGITYDNIQSLNINELPHRNKQTNGKRVNMTEALGANTFDIILDVTIRFTPTSTGSIDNIRAANDGQKHSYSDGETSGNFVIETGSLTRAADSITKQSRNVSFRLVEW